MTAGQVQEWSGDADLVYLSACETAVGPARFADGMPGLQRAFLRAGAHGVVATLWQIEDVYARQFATDFYRRYTEGVPAARALSETQRAWLLDAPGIRASEQAYRRMTAWAHVYYAPRHHSGPVSRETGPDTRLQRMGESPRPLAAARRPRQ